MDTPNTPQDMPSAPNMGPVEQEHHMNPNKIIIPILLALVVILAGYFVLRGGDKAEFPGESEVIYTVLDNPAISKIPVGFPTDVPVEEQNIKESYKVNYFEEGVTQYTVAFNTEMSRGDLWKLYTDMFLAAGYTQDADKTSEGKGVLTGWRSGNKLNVAMSDYDGMQYVTINFIERQVSGE